MYQGSFIFYKEISHAQKAQKAQRAQKSTKSIKSKQVTFLLLDVFDVHKSVNSIKSTKRQTNDSLLLRCFYAHKNAVFFVSHTKKRKKHKKHTKNIKADISEQATFLSLDVFKCI